MKWRNSTRGLKHLQNSFALQNNIKNYLPNTWLSTFIGCIGDVSNGSTPSRKKPEYWNGEILWVSSGEVSNNFIEKTKESITQFGHESCSVSLLPAHSSYCNDWRG